MAVLIRRQELEIPVDFHGFALQEYDDMEVPVPFPEERAELENPPFLTPYEMRLDVYSAGHTHTAVLIVEVWDGEPPADKGARWEARDEAEIFSVTGQLSVEVIAGCAKDTVELGAPDTLWRVRLCSTGRAEVARLAQVGVPHGVERYTAGFWPVRP
ncbi:hypothetical protein [Streptomyces sp. MNU89]|uniref:hypothetical protein n=1 Tax=Streptomyces sp. MNU89 TaxID=2560025 RepID=UPI001E50C2B4|nr:hypothetical protein [Streptomyces sp. MNU89]MCC9738477.1 hypothetical protein [Streptomyces sp. MNU89]